MISLYEAVNNSLNFYMDVALNEFKGKKHKFVYYCKDNGRYYYKYPRKCKELIKILTEYIVEFISSKKVVEIMKWIMDNKISIPLDVYDPIARQYIFNCGLINIFQDNVIVCLWKTCSEDILRELEKLKSAPFRVEFIIGLEEYLNAVIGRIK